MGSLNDVAAEIVRNAVKDVERIRADMVERHQKELAEFDQRMETAKKDAAALDRMARDLPSKFFDRYAAMFSGEAFVENHAVSLWKSFSYLSVRLPTGETQIHPVFGSVCEPGRYRVVVLFEKVS